MDYCIDLEKLYTKGITNLYYGGVIVHTIDEDGSSYVLCRDDVNGPSRILMSDDETILDCKWSKSETGIEYVVGTAEISGAQVYLTKEEFNIAVMD